jgi:glycosyltransferase involved in cell wall biosynthesis
MEEISSSKDLGAELDQMVVKYHKPKVSVIIPNFNYSDFLRDALLSVQQQTYDNFECIVVDDHSDKQNFKLAVKLLEEMNDSRFSIIRNEENIGQVHSIYRGLDRCDATFVSILDPDDRYAPLFIERLLALHLSPVIYCPIVCCDQYLLRIGDGIVTGTQSDSGTALFDPEKTKREQACYSQYGFHRFLAPTENGWHWSTTSSMMFRSDALRTFRPSKKLSYVGQGDSYCAQGSHMLGGTILLNEPLVYRGLHQNNDFISNSVYSIFVQQAKPGAQFLADRVKIDVMEAFLANGGLETVDLNDFREVVYAHFPGTYLSDLIANVPIVKELLTGIKGY